MKKILTESRELFRKTKKSSRVDSKSHLYDLFVNRLKEKIIKKFNLENSIYKVKASLGQGNMTTHPWVSILNTKITSSTQEGLYVVLLFDSSFTSFYVSLNQGITYFQNKYKNKKYNYAMRMVEYFRNGIDNNSKISYEPINLIAKKGSLAYGYEKTNIASRKFNILTLDEKELEETIKLFLKIYDELYNYMPPGKKYDELVYSVLLEEKDAYTEIDEAIHNIEEAINKEVRVPEGAKQKLTMMKPGKPRPQKYPELTTPVLRKTDWIGKAKDDAITGLMGELLVLQYERERLISLVLYEFADKIAHVSIESDGFGYDIRSYDYDNTGTVSELYIEVKSSVLKIDTNFFVSKNELEKSKVLNDRYAVYRIYNMNDINPKFYIAKGEIEENFYLDPITYSATYKYLLN